MKKIILTEKPSVAADFATALSCSRNDGFFEGPAHVVTFAFGHLLELCMPEDYNPELKKWSLDNLPIIPDEFSYKTISSGKKQLATISRLLSRPDINEIILATDAGREGELIGRSIIDYAASHDKTRSVASKTVKRFWSSEALTPEVIHKGLASLRPIEETYDLYEAGLYRSHADWIAGINLSRFFSLKLNGSFSVGRVQTATMALVCSRERDIQRFTPEPYFKLKATLRTARNETFSAWLEKGEASTFQSLDTLAQVRLLLAPGRSLKIGSVRTVPKSEQPPMLLNLTTLQIEASKRLGLTAQKTLETAQALYEKHKCLSYPRTPSRVLAESNFSMVQGLITSLSSSYSSLSSQLDPSKISQNNTRVFNDKALVDHHALIPLQPAPASLSQAEAGVFDIVLRSFFAAFSLPYRYSSTTVDVPLEGGYSLVARGVSNVIPGWKAVFTDPPKDKTEQPEDDEDTKALPLLSEAESIAVVSTAPIQKFTKPPARFTEATLLAAMENPAKFLSGDTEAEFEKGVGLGTPATRDTIIETILSREYITRSKKSLVPTDKGLFLYDSMLSIDSVRPFLLVDQTAEWEKLLEEVPKIFFGKFHSFIVSSFAVLLSKSLEAYEAKKEEFGKCPICGGLVFEGKSNFYCSEYKKGCGFKVWKETSGAKVSSADVKALLSSGVTKRELSFVSGRSGKPFKAKLAIESGSVRFKFDEKTAAKR